MRPIFATMIAAMALLGPAAPSAKASVIVEFSFPATVTEWLGTPYGPVFQPTQVTGLLFGLAASGTSSVTGIEITSVTVINFDLMSFILDNSFTLTDGVVSCVLRG
jgi:hypothetical protein